MKANKKTSSNQEDTAAKRLSLMGTELAQKGKNRKDEEANRHLELASGTSKGSMSKCELAYAEFAKKQAKAQVIDKLSLFFQYYEKTDKFIASTKLYEIKQVKHMTSGEIKAAIIFRKAEIKPETLAMIR